MLASAVHSSLGELKDVNIFLDGSTLSTNNGTADTPFDLAKGETLTITINGQLSPILLGGSEIRNEAEIEWTSYQNPVTGAPSPKVQALWQQTMSSVPATLLADPGQRNNYNDFDPTLILIRPQFDKVPGQLGITVEPDASAANNYTLAAPDDTDGINNGREVVIGEFLTYRIEITVPEAVFFNVSLNDNLDPGLALVSVDNIAVTGDWVFSGINVTLESLVTHDWTNDPFDDPDDIPLNSVISYSYETSGQDTLSIDFGNISNLVPSPDVQEVVIIEYTVMATDLAANSGDGPGTPGTQLQNEAFLTFRNANAAPLTTGATLAADTVEILEPKLDVEQAVELFTPGSPDVPGAPGDAGDKVLYTISVRHTSETEADAYDLGLTDIFENSFDAASLAVDSATITFADS